MKSLIIRSSLITGGILTIFLIILTVLSINKTEFASSMVFGFSLMILAFSVIFFGLKNYRDKQNGGELTFMQAFRAGLAIATIGSALYVVVWAICYKFFTPDFLDYYADMCLNQARKKNASAAEIGRLNQMIAETREAYKSPFWFSFYTFLEVFPVGFVVTLLSALILKKKKKDRFAAA